MGVSDVCPTVDTIRAFLEHLVDPMLPEKPSIRDEEPALSQQHKVAKQVFSFIFTILLEFGLHAIRTANSWIVSTLVV